MGFASGLLYATFNLAVFFSLMAFGGGRSEAFKVGFIHELWSRVPDVVVFGFGSESVNIQIFINFYMHTLKKLTIQCRGYVFFSNARPVTGHLYHHFLKSYSKSTLHFPVEDGVGFTDSIPWFCAILCKRRLSCFRYERRFPYWPDNLEIMNTICVTSVLYRLIFLIRDCPWFYISNEKQHTKM